MISRLLLARLIVLYERVWPRLWPLLIGLLIFAALGFFDAFTLLPGFVHGILLLALLGAAGFYLYAIRAAFRWPKADEALGRLETDNRLEHRPLRLFADRLVLGQGEPLGEALWAAHKARAEAAIGRIHLRAPRPDIPSQDPFGLRVAATAIALIGFLYAGSEWQTRLGTALVPDFTPAGALPVTVDAWVTPPKYTGLAPLFLPPAGSEPAAPISVPEGSILTLRVSGPERVPVVRREVADPKSLPGDWRRTLALEAESGATYKLDMPLEFSALHELRNGRASLAKWNITVTPDAPPAVKLTKPIGESEKFATVIAYEATDDYGIESIEAQMGLVDPSAAAVADDLQLLDPKAQINLALSTSRIGGRTISATERLDLTSHPWAGREVAITLLARDGIAQTGFSRKERVRLPMREFTDPLAKALIEQRALLAAAPRANQERVRRSLDALAIAPESFAPDTVTYLALRVAFHQLTDDLNLERITAVHDLLWETALHLEDGDLSLAEEALRDAQRALMDALSRDASDEEIAELMAELRAALARYLTALQIAALEAEMRGETLPQLAPGGEVLTAEDFARMMQSLEDMAATGSREAARQLLAEMQSILEGLRPPSGGQMSAEESAMSDALNQLADIIRGQKTLLDESHRQSPEGGGAMPSDRSMNALTRDQAELRERLEALRGMLEKGAPTNTDALKGAEGDMGDAQDALSAGRAEEAVPSQKSALDRLQEGMQELAQSLAQSMGGQAAGADGSQSGRDPLGRQPGGNANLQDENVKVPDELRLQRARRILDEIQRRASDPARPGEELDYLDRLLDLF